MTRPLVFLAAPLLVFLGCSPERQREEQAPAKRTAAADAAPYTLQMEFLGLMAFVTQNGGVWALLPKTDYDPANPNAADLPPFVLAELLATRPTPVQLAATLRNDYPTHVATLQLTNAVVTRAGQPVPPQIDLKGQDVRFLDLAAAAPFQPPALGLLVSADEVIKTTQPGGFQLTPEQKVMVQQLDKVDQSLLAANLDRRLTARVRIDFGRLVAEADPDPDRRFTFHLPIQGVGCTQGPLKLGEEVIEEVQNLQAGFRIQLLPSGDELTVEPADRNRPLLVQILYRTPDGRDTHPKPFRWFHGLSKPPLTPGDLHYIPCLQPPFIGNKCPQREMTP